MALVGDVSPDGRWFWDGQRWVSAVSPDGAWRWNGTAWVAGVSTPAVGTSTGRGLLRRVPGFRSHVPWKMGVAAVAYLGLAGIASVSFASALVGSNAPQNNPHNVGSPVAQVGTPSSYPAAPAPSSKPLSIPSPTPSPKHSPSPSPKPKPPPSPKPAPAPKSTCGAPANPWGYNFCGGRYITSPPANFCSYFRCIPSFWKSTNGYVDECHDGTYSHSGGRQGACSYHGGELRPLYRP